MVEFVRDFQKYVTEHPDLKDIGSYVQNLTEEQLQRIFPSRDVLPQIKFGVPEKELVDILVLHKDAWLFIECKGRQPRLNKSPFDPADMEDWMEKVLNKAKNQRSGYKRKLEQGHKFPVRREGLERIVDYSMCPKALSIVTLYRMNEIGIAEKIDSLRDEYGESGIQIIDLLELPWLTSYLNADEFVRYFVQREELFSSGKAQPSYDRNLLLYFLMNKDGFQSLIDAEDPYLHFQANNITLQLQGFNFREYHTSLEEEVVSRNKEFFGQFRGETL